MIPLPNHGPPAYHPPPTTGIRQAADSISRRPYHATRGVPGGRASVGLASLRVAAVAQRNRGFLSGRRDRGRLAANYDGNPGGGATMARMRVVDPAAQVLSVQA